MIRLLKDKARQLKNNIKALYLLGKDRLLTWPVQLLVLITVGYALSPIDLIPDFIPVLGYLDDLIILPLMISLVLKLIPKSILDDYRTKAKSFDETPTNWYAGIAFIALWLIIAGFILMKIL